MLIINNAFTEIERNAIWGMDSSTSAISIIQNNTFINNQMQSTAIGANIYNSTIKFNTFKNWDCAIDLTEHNIIQYNTFIGNNVAVIMSRETYGDVQHINYNNFINNSFSIQVIDNANQPNCKYNYYGTSSTEPSIIAQQILDVCDGVSGGLITWWPWYTEQIDFELLPLYPEEATLKTIYCVTAE
eukprot:195924_1